MSNLLPPETQKEVWRLYRTRFITIGSLVFLVGAFLSFLAFLPTYVLSRANETTSAQASGSSLSENGDERISFSSDREKIQRAQVLLAQFSPLATSSPALQAIEEALEVRPRGVVIQDIQYMATGSAQEGTIILSGSAGNRADIQAYREALVGTPRFTSVSLPVGVLAGTEGGQFSVTLTGMF